MAILVVKHPSPITFFCRRCGTEFVATYPSWHKTKTGKSCSCPTCSCACFKRD